MVHRLALLMGVAGAAGVLTLAVALNGSASPPTSGNDFVPVANDIPGGDQLAQAAPSDQPARTAEPSGRKVVDKVYVLPAPKGAKHNQPTHTPRPARNNGDDTGADDTSVDHSSGTSDEAGGEDHNKGGDQAHDGGSGDGQEQGDD